MVIGGASGIGAACAVALAADGCEVVVADLPGTEADVECDVTSEESVAALFDGVVASHGRVDVVVNSAGTSTLGLVVDHDAAEFRRVVDVCLTGGFLVMKHAGRVLGAGGSITSLTSLNARQPGSGMGAYCAAKWGQLGLVRSLQMEVRSDPAVSVSLVMPGAIDTPIYHQAATYAGSRGSAPPPVVSPEAVAEACVRCLDRPRRMVHVGPVNRLAVIGYRLAPAIYDRVAPLLVRQVVLRGPAAPVFEGNVFGATPAGESLRGGWTLTGRLREPGRRRAHWRRRSR